LQDAELTFSFSNPLQDAIRRNRVYQAQQALGLAAAAEQVKKGTANAVNALKMLQDAVRGTGAPADWLYDEDDAANAAAETTQAGNILTAIGAAGQAADVVNSGAEAAQKLQELNQPAADSSFVYGPA
jgi:hypothetical protein